MTEPNVLSGYRAFFGRRKGHRLREGQERLLTEHLPSLVIDCPSSGLLDPRSLFTRPVSDVWLEIGFGGGEHLLHQARSHPDIGFIGCEPFVNGTAKLVSVVAHEGLDNIRLHADDATVLISRLAPDFLGKIFLLYPDPWPKRRQRKRRFVSHETITALARVARSGAEWRFATDIDDYASWTLARIAQSSQFTWTASRMQDWAVPWSD